MDSSIISFDGGADSDAFSPEVKKAKAAPKKAAAATKPKTAPKAAQKKTTQTTLKTPATKKRAKPDSEDDENTDVDDDSLLSKQSGTPPNAKKQKVAPVKKSSGKPLGQIDNESYDVDSGVAEGRPASAKKNKTGTEQYQKVRCFMRLCC
jgi:DNA topoisomerase-2